MGVATEIGQHLFGTTERGFGIDHPVDASQFVETFGECRWFGQVGEIAEEVELADVEGILQLSQEQPTEQTCEHSHRQEEAWSASDPTCAVERGSAAGNDTMDVRMVLQGLAPGVENHGRAELGAEMSRIGGDGGERLGRRVEQDRVDKGLVLEGDLADRCRSAKQNVGLPLPCLSDV
jgi:hypothetical protein